MIKSQYNIRNDDTNENIEILGEFKSSPKKMRYNEKISMNNSIVNQWNGLMIEGTFTVSYLDSENYLLVEKAWENDNKLWIEDINGRRYLLSIVGEALDLTPIQNNVNNTVYYTGSLTLKGGR